MTDVSSVLKAVAILLLPDLSHTFSTSTGEGVPFLFMYPIAKASSRSLDIEFRYQVLSRRKELKDLSHEHVPTGRIRSSIDIVCMFG